MKVSLKDISSFYGIIIAGYSKFTSDSQPSSITSTAGSTKEKYIKNWTRDAILMLINNLRQKYDRQFRSSTIKTDKCWELVIDDLKKGCVVTLNQCRDK